MACEQQLIEVYRSEGDSNWTVITLEGDEDLELSSVKITISAQEIYQEVTF